MPAGSSRPRPPRRRVARPAEIVTTLKATAAIIGVPYDRCQKARTRHPDTFPTVWIDGMRHHRPSDVARFMGVTSTAQPVIHETPS